jgi:hypothetical protein
MATAVRATSRAIIAATVGRTRVQGFEVNDNPSLFSLAEELRCSAVSHDLLFLNAVDDNRNRLA